MACQASDTPPPLQGSPLEVVDRDAGLLIAGMIASIFVGCAADKLFCKKCNEGSREPSWVVVLLLVSYGYLIPGLILTLFSFNIVLDCGVGNSYGVGPGGGFNEMPGVTESMLGLVKLLSDTGSWVGAVLVVIYAIVIPALKLLLLAVGNLMQGKNGTSEWSRRSIQCVQNISKWACPDMFAYILLMHLVRTLNHEPNLRAVGKLDLGFSCFSLFCVGSTVASLGIRVPDREHGCFQKIGRVLGAKRLLFVVGPAFVTFAVLFFIGLQTTVMSLRVGKLPAAVDMMITLMGLKDDLSSDVSIWQCMGGLVHAVGQGEVNSFIGLIMFAVFVVGMTLLDMIVLLLIAVLKTIDKNGKRWMKFAWILKKLSMLDVTLMGILVVTLCMYMYREYVIVSMGTGQWILLASEVIHYLTYYVVKGTIEHSERGVDLGNAIKQDMDEDSNDDTSTSEGDSNESDDEKK